MIGQLYFAIVASTHMASWFCGPLLSNWVLLVVGGWTRWSLESCPPSGSRLIHRTDWHPQRAWPRTCGPLCLGAVDSGACQQDWYTFRF